MQREHLASLIDDMRRRGRETAVVEHRGVRHLRTSYGEIAELAGRFSAELRGRGIVAGERVALWGVSSAEWIAAFFGCVLRGVIVVPLDAAGAREFVERVVADTQAKLVVGDAELLRGLRFEGAKMALEELQSEAAAGGELRGRSGGDAGCAVSDCVHVRHDFGAEGNCSHAQECAGEPGADRERDREVSEI